MSEVTAAVMHTLAGQGEFVLEVKKSRFIGRALALPGPAAAPELIQRTGESEARHNCWAWRHGQNYRFHDADEPSGTAGKPILAAIDGQGVDQVLVVVTRYFGGIKLGAGGLVRAYAHAAAEALRAAPKRALIALQQLRMDVPMRLRGAVERALLAHQGQLLACDYPSGPQPQVRLSVELPASAAAAFAQQIRNLSSGQVEPGPL